MQSTAANQPLWGTHATLPSGIRAPQFDGSNDFMSVADLGIYNGQAAGTLTAIVHDFARTAGDATHVAIQITGGTGLTRSAMFTRLSAANNFTVAGARVDGETVVTRTSASADGLNRLTGLFVWGGNTLQGIFNGVATATTTFTGGAGITSPTDSTLFNIGATNATTNRLNGIIAHAMAARIVLTTDQNTALRNLQKQFYTALP